ncbi:hypothetical protein ACWA1F_19870 [Flavobacterium sp. 3-218]
MGKGIIFRRAGEGFFSESETYLENFDNITHHSGTQVIYNAKENYFVDNWEEIPSGKYFIKGWWTDNKNIPIKNSYVGDIVRFHVQTKDIPNGEEILFTVYDWDGLKILNDKLKLSDVNTSQEINKIKIQGNTGFVEWKTGIGTLSLLEEFGEGDEIELFVECTYKDETIQLPERTDDYLIVFEKEILISVIIELPHSRETGWGAKGLAGHSAMAIGERYFDYGPNNTSGTYSESQYDVDFNKDGDKDDDVYLDNPTFKNSPGQPWWGTHIAQRKGIKPEEVTLTMVYEHIKLSWKNIEDSSGNIIQYGTFIYGKVHKIEFYVKESEANKMIKWWQERYRHLKIYSVYPWTGEQCTTTVKTAIHQAFPSNMFERNYIPNSTQKPSGLLEDLQSFVSTSKEHAGQLSNITVIKAEALDWTE